MKTQETLGDQPSAIALGHDHASLALMPFMATRDGHGHGPVTFTHQTVIDGRLRRTSYTLIPGDGGELPTTYDQPVLLALLQLWLQDQAAPTRQTFSRREVMNLLRWSQSGAYTERFAAALRRLTELTIRVETTLLARNGAEYSGRETAAHIIDRYELGKGRDAEGFIVWGDLIREGRTLGDFKRLDWDLLLSLGDPIAAQLYRVIDRATLAGETEWKVRWRTLASLLGMTPDGYARPGKLKARLAERLDGLVEAGVLVGWGYTRGGEFEFRLKNYLRVRLRAILMELGVYHDAARQLVAGYDEWVIMAQTDAMTFRRPKPKSPGGYLVEAVRERYELRYPDDEPEAFLGLWGFLGTEQQRLYHQAGLDLRGTVEDLFDCNPDPTAWSPELRAVVRFMVCYNLDPEQVVRHSKAARAIDVG